MRAQEKQALQALDNPKALAYTHGDRLMIKDGGLNTSYPIAVLASLQRKGFVLVVRDRIGLSAAGEAEVRRG